MLGLLKRNKELIYIYIYLFDSLRIFIARYLRSLADNFNLKGTLIFAPSLIQIPSHTQNLLLDVGSSNPVKDFFNALTHTHTHLLSYSLIRYPSTMVQSSFHQSIHIAVGDLIYLQLCSWLPSQATRLSFQAPDARFLGATEIKEKTANKKQPSACMPFSEGNSTSN